MTFVVRGWVSGLAVVLSALLCPGRLVATRSSPLLVGLVFSLAPSGSVLVVAGAILGWHGQESGAKFFILVLNFTQPPHFTFTFSIHHLAAIILHCCPDYGMPPWDLLPPAAAPLRRRPLCVCVSSPSPSPLLYISRGTGGHLSGWAEASPGAALHGDPFIVNQRLTSPFCA